MIAFATALHALAATVWVGGMFFAYMALRPALGPLPPSERLPLWGRTFARFFAWVWVSIAILLATGYGIMFGGMGGFAGAPPYVHLMQGLGILMILIFLHLWFAPYARLRRALAEGHIPIAAAQISQIRTLVAVNLGLGLLTVLIGAGGRHW